MNKYQLFSVQHHLSDWPESFTFNKIINVMESGDDDGFITPWEQFEELTMRDIARMIKSMAKNLQLVFMG